MGGIRKTAATSAWRMFLSTWCAFVSTQVFPVNIYPNAVKVSGASEISDNLVSGFAGSVNSYGGDSILSGSGGQIATLSMSASGAVIEGGYFSRYVSTPATVGYQALYKTSAAVTGSESIYPNPSATIYEVEYSTSPDFTGAVMYASSTTWPVSLTGLADETTYFTRLRATYMGFDPSPYASLLSLFVCGSAPVYPPSNLAAESRPGNRIYLSWDLSPAANAAQYSLYSDYGTGAIDYGSPMAVLTSTETGYTTPVIASSGSYKFTLRAMTACGSEESNVNVMASAPAVEALTGVKTAVRIPQTGKRLSGNRVTVMAEPILGDAAQIRQVIFQYKASTAAEWLEIIPANLNHLNPDTDPPYVIHWDVTGLVQTEYDIRAVAVDVRDDPDPTPPAIAVSVDLVDPDISENTVAGGVVKKEQKVNNEIQNIIQAADEGTAQVTRVALPAGSLNASTITVSVTNSPALIPPALEGAESAGVISEVSLSNSQSQLTAGKTAEITLYYPDENNDGIVDGTAVRADTLRMYSCDGLTGTWRDDLNSRVNFSGKGVTGRSSHFSFFALFTPLAANLDSVAVYPIPFKPNDGDPDTGAPYSAGDPNSGIIFDNLPAVVSIKIYTVSGQLVDKFGSDASSGKLQWDVRNEDGRPVASGGYIAAISSPGQKTITKKIVVIR